MNPAIIAAVVTALLFTLMTIRIKQARARAAAWRNLAIAAGALAVFIVLKKAPKFYENP